MTSQPTKMKPVMPACFQRTFDFTRAARQIDLLRPGSLQRLGGVGGLGRIHLVGRAQTGEFRAGRLERRDHVVAAGEAVVRNGLDAACLEEVPGVKRARGEIRELAEVGEKHLRPCAGLCKRAV